MKGIILAAGKGLRLNGGSGEDPKCLVKIGGTTLIERQIRSLRTSGIEDIVVVVGFRADRVRRVCEAQAQFIENTRYEETNSLYSLWLTRHLLPEGFVVMNSDVLFHPHLLRDLLSAPCEDALLVALRDKATPTFGDEEMKVKVRDGRVVDITKAMDPGDADGENVGIAKFGPSGAELLVEKMDALVAKGSLKEWAPRAFRDFAAERDLHVIGTGGSPWIEIDFPEDYLRATNDILPKIDMIDESASQILSVTARTEADRSSL